MRNLLRANICFGKFRGTVLSVVDDGAISSRGTLEHQLGENRDFTSHTPLSRKLSASGAIPRWWSRREVPDPGANKSKNPGL